MTSINRPLLYAGLLGATLMLAGCGEPEKTEAPRQQAAAPADPNLVKAGENLTRIIKLGEVTSAELSDTLRVAGQVDFDEQRITRIGATVTGRIIDLQATLGQQVKVGQTLAVLNSTELGAAQLAYMKARAQAQLNERGVERARQLLAADVIGSAELQRRESELAISMSEQRAAADQLRVLGVSQKSLERLSSTGAINSVSPVVATMAGTVVERRVTQGQVVQPSEVLFSIADLSRVWVEADVPEQQAGQVKAGQNIEVDIPSLGQRLTAKLIYIADTVDPVTRTVTVRSELDNTDRTLKPAMLATVLIETRPTPRLVVPGTAVVRESESDQVFVEVAPGEYRMTPVRLDKAIGDVRPVLSGLKEGERIVVDGAFHLNNERKRKETD
jgi:cobalt-zinc-cadmium efflux system membrane fusion protein